MKEIEYVRCGTIDQEFGLEKELLHYQNVRPPKKENVGPFYKGFDIGAQRVNAGFANLDLSEGIRTTEVEIKGVRVRMYRSQTLCHPSPCILYIHGGGFVAGILDFVEHPCKRLAQLSDSCVVSIDYGLAPEYPFPHAIYQCLDVLKNLNKDAEFYNIDRNNIAIAGDSAGANIAIAVAQLDAQDQSILTYMMLYYPVIDQCMERKNGWSYEFYGAHQNEYTTKCIASLVDCERMFNTCYIQEEDANNPLASCIRMKGDIALPPMVIISAEYDYLRYSEEQFYQKFKDIYDIHMICYRGVNHGFLDKLGVFPQADDSVQRIARMWKEKVNESAYMNVKSRTM